MQKNLIMVAQETATGVLDTGYICDIKVGEAVGDIIDVSLSLNGDPERALSLTDDKAQAAITLLNKGANLDAQKQQSEYKRIFSVVPFDQAIAQ